jgi:hypothetical protein
MSWKTNDSGITVPDWWDPKFPWRESCVYLPREVDLKADKGDWLWLIAIEPDQDGRVAYSIAGILGDIWVYPEPSENVSDWSARCHGILEMYAEGAKSVLGEISAATMVKSPPEEWFVNGLGT